MRITIGLILLLNFLNAPLVSGQSENDELPLDQLFPVSWSGKNGQKANNITGGIQANSGYIWLTSYIGVQRFDGYQTEVYAKEQMSYLSSNGFRNVYQSPYDDKLYFVSQSSGIVTFSSGEFRPFKLLNGTIPSSVSSLLITGPKEMYVGSFNNGLSYVKDDSISKIQDTVSEKSVIPIIYKANNGVIYFGTEGQGLAKLVNGQVVGRWSVEDGLSNNVVSSLISWGDTLFIGTQSGINIMINDSIQSIQFMNGESINDMTIRNNSLLAGSNNGLGRMSLESQIGEFATSIDGVDISRVNRLFFDIEGSLWLCTGRNGIVQLRETNIKNFNKYDGFTNDNINIVTESYDNKAYYIGSDDGKIYLLRDNQIKQLQFNGFNGVTGIRDILEEEDGTLWVASYKGVIKKTAEKETLYGLANGFPSLDIRRIFKDKAGNLWFGSRSGGLVKMINDTIVEVYDKNNQLNSNFIFSIEEDQSGNLYVGTHSGGLYKIAGDQIEHFNILKDDVGIIIFNTHISSGNRIWVVSTAGIFLYDSGSFTKLNLDTPISGLSMYDFLEDQKGNAYITTNVGVLRISRQDLERFYKNSTYIITPVVIDDKNGMTSEECTGAVRSLKAKDGDIYIPTIGGVSIIDTDKKVTINLAPFIYVESIQSSTGEYFIDDSVQLQPGANRYSLEFTALSYFAPERIKFKYKLSNFDGKFTEVNGVRNVEYTNLAPGDYTFELKATNGFDQWSEETAFFHFTVLPAFYETEWFYIVCVLLIVSLVYGIYRWRVAGITKMNKKLIKVNKELDSFVYSASHDLRSPIASVLGLIELSHMDPDNIDLYLDRMEESMKKLDEFIAEIIDFSSNERKSVNKDKIDFNKLASKVVKELSFLNVDGEVEIKIKVEQLEEFISDARRIAIIFRNLISNSLKYRKVSRSSSFIAIEISVVSGLATIKIEDNGIGISDEDKGKVFDMFYRASEISKGSGLGLYIVKETIEKLEGELHFESTLGEGTIFVMNIPSLD